MYLFFHLYFIILHYLCTQTDKYGKNAVSLASEMD